MKQDVDRPYTDRSQIARVHSRPMYPLIAVAVAATGFLALQWPAWRADMLEYDAQANLPLVALGIPVLAALLLILFWSWLMAEALLGRWTVEAGASGVTVTHDWMGLRLGRISLPTERILSIRVGMVPGTIVRAILVDCGDERWHPLVRWAGLSRGRAEGLAASIAESLGVVVDAQGTPLRSAQAASSLTPPPQPSIWTRDLGGLTLVGGAMFATLFIGCIPGLWIYFIYLSHAPFALLVAIAYVVAVFVASLLWLRPRVAALFALQAELARGGLTVQVREAVWGRSGLSGLFLGQHIAFGSMCAFVGAAVIVEALRDRYAPLAVTGAALLAFGIGYWRVMALFPRRLRGVRRDLATFARSGGADQVALERAAQAIGEQIHRLPQV